MPITTAICNSFKREILEGVHETGDVYKIALYTSAADLDKTTTAYAATNEVVGTGYTAGGATLAGYASALAGDAAYIDWADPSWENASITARGALIYNATQANRAVAAYDFGVNVSSTNGTFTVTLPPPGAAAVVRVA